MMIKKRVLVLGLFFCAVVVVGLLFSPYSFAGSANLEKVRAKQLPLLQQKIKARGLTFGAPIFIRIFKASSELELWLQDGDQYTLYKTYPICKYSGELGAKKKEGDGQSPEGFYKVSAAQMNPHSSYHLSFNLGFPNAYDKAHGRTGSYLMVHGNCVSIGCYAMTNEGIEEIYLLAEAAHAGGQKAFSVHSYPFRMTEENFQTYKNPEWLAFWQNLKQGYDFFETHKKPARVTVKNGRYVVN